jgi:Fe-S cluster biogenesis protein NfuA
LTNLTRLKGCVFNLVRRMKGCFPKRLSWGKLRREKKMRERIEKALDKVRPMLMADGGNVELVEVTSDGIVKLKLKGSCGCCPMSSMTLKNGIEKILRQEVPEIKEVVAL